MSFNKYLVPKPSQMIEVLENGVGDFFRRKIDSYIGDAISMQMIDDAWGLYSIKMKEDEIIETLRKKYSKEIGETSSTL